MTPTSIPDKRGDPPSVAPEQLSPDQRRRAAGFALAALLAGLAVAAAPFAVRGSETIPILLAILGGLFLLRSVLHVATLFSPVRPAIASGWRNLWQDPWLIDHIEARYPTTALGLGIIRLILLAMAALALTAAIVVLIVAFEPGTPVVLSFAWLIMARIAVDLLGGSSLIVRVLFAVRHPA